LFEGEGQVFHPIEGGNASPIPWKRVPGITNSVPGAQPSGVATRGNDVSYRPHEGEGRRAK